MIRLELVNFAKDNIRFDCSAVHLQEEHIDLRMKWVKYVKSGVEVNVFVEQKNVTVEGKWDCMNNCTIGSV